MSKFFRVGLTVTGAMAGVLSLGTATAVADPAPPGTYTVHEHRKATVNATECYLFANPVNYSGSTIVGTGGWTSCVGSPVACTSHVTLTIYLTPGWVAAGNQGETTACPPPLRSAPSTVTNCKIQPTNYSYRVHTIGSFVESSGGATSTDANGTTKNIPCL